MKLYNKLVRDRIPEIMEANGEIPIARILDPDEYLACLEAKLDEEVCEFHESKDPEELADILEVVYALAEAHGCNKQALFDICQQKNNARGGFSKRIFLIEKSKIAQKI